MKRRNNVIISIFACAAKGERSRSQTSRDAIGIFIVDRRKHGHPHAQERSETLLKNFVQLTRYENRMVFMLQNSTIEEQRGITEFLTAKGVKLASIYCRMVTIHG